MDVNATINRVRYTTLTIAKTTSVKVTDGLQRLKALASDNGGLAVSRVRVMLSDLGASLSMLRK